MLHRAYIYIHIYIYNECILYSTSSITSYIVGFILTDCFENLTFTPFRYKYSWVSSFVFYREHMEISISRCVFLFPQLDARITGTVVIYIIYIKKKKKRKEKRGGDKTNVCTMRSSKQSRHMYTHAVYFRYTVMYSIIIIFRYTMEL